MIKLFARLFIVLFFSVQLSAKDFNGFINFSYNEQSGKVSLNVKELNKDFLLVSYFATGLGSNDIGFDRGKITSQRLVRFEKYGSKLALIESNTFFKAITNNKNESKVANDAFASSILWIFNIEKDSSGLVIDFTPFLTEDLSSIALSLKDQKQGNFKLDKTKSVIDPNQLFAFPNNIEFESWLSFGGEATGEYLKSTAVNPEILSMKQHISLVQLPDDNYKPRKFHPYSGYFDKNFYDYATPIYEPIEKRLIMRHRLEKKNPNQAKSEAIEPIIYYVDNGCPEPIKTALIEGARWWNQAFEEAGFINGFQVKELPEDAHPLDVRYNTIQWVHRSTRGWSYGSSISDPRTGEIIKGHVTLGSLRVRQDFMIAQGLLSIYEGDKKDHTPMIALALARLRQLSAHEVGHTIGLAHNFSASVNDRASVMDYPHPVINMDGNINMDIKNAYDDKIGLWDKRAIVYGYAQFGKNEEEELEKIISQTKAMGLKYLSDPDARPDGSAAFESHLWDNGKDPVVELNRILDYRKVALQKFGLNSITKGTPLSELEKVLVPVYYAHRYQVEAVSKAIGGMHYTYATKGDLDSEQIEVSLDKQKLALTSILNSMSAENLLLPSHIKKLILPNAMGYAFTRESFNNETGYGFDQNAAASAAIDHAYNLLFHPQRLARINNQGLMSLQEYFKLIYSKVKAEPSSNNEALKINIIRERNFVMRLLALAQMNKKGYAAAPAIAVLEGIDHELKKSKASGNNLIDEHRIFIKSLLKKWTNNEPIEITAPLNLPPGAPIGCE